MLVPLVSEVSAAFIGHLGVTACVGCALCGAAFGVSKAGSGLAQVVVSRVDLANRGIIPVIMADLISIYGLILGVVIASTLSKDSFNTYKAFACLGAGLSGGLACTCAGTAIGIVGDSGMRASAQSTPFYTKMIVILIFAEALGLYGVIVALILSFK